jgi:hypothetical protein
LGPSWKILLLIELPVKTMRCLGEKQSNCSDRQTGSVWRLLCASDKPLLTIGMEKWRFLLFWFLLDFEKRQHYFTCGANWRRRTMPDGASEIFVYCPRFREVNIRLQTTGRHCLKNYRWTELLVFVQTQRFVAPADPAPGLAWDFGLEPDSRLTIDADVRKQHFIQQCTETHFLSLLKAFDENTQ